MWRAAPVVRDCDILAISAAPRGGVRDRPSYPAGALRPAATALTVIPRVPKTVAWPATQLPTAALIAASALPGRAFSGTTLMIDPPERRWSPTVSRVSTADSMVWF